MKECAKCRVTKELSAKNFHRNKTKRIGFESSCKPCVNERQANWTKNNKVKKSLSDAKYRNNNKKKVAEYQKNYRLENFDNIAEYKRGWFIKNKDKMVEYSKVYYQANKEKMDASTRNYAKTYRSKVRDNQRKWQSLNLDVLRIKAQERRANKSGTLAGFNQAEWDECKAHFKYECCYCGGIEPLEQDHFIALNKKGRYTKDNIVPACKRCNSSKQDKCFFEWYPNHVNHCADRELIIVGYLDMQGNNQTKQSFEQLTLI